MAGRRRFGIPLVFLCSLALGIWTGSGWHAAAHSAVRSAAAVCACAGNPWDARQDAAIDGQISACQTCALSAHLPEIPAAQAAAAPRFVPSYEVSAFSTQVRSIRHCILPPGRAPPQFHS